MVNYLILFPTQLFSTSVLNSLIKTNYKIILWEHPYYMSRYKYHKLKLAFHRASMTYYANQKKSYYIESDKFNTPVKITKSDTLLFIHPIEHDMLKNIVLLARSLKCNYIIHNSPYFLNQPADETGITRHDVFYKYQRVKHDIMLKHIGNKTEPEGGKWSFDTENRLPFEKNQTEPKLIKTSNNEKKYINQAIKYILDKYPNNYGNLESQYFIYPISHKSANNWLKHFVKNKLDNFGKYEDAISIHIKFGYHSLLSPLLNVGLITPLQILTEVEKYKKNIASKEGFIRQVFGWREYCHYIYSNYDNLSDYTFFVQDYPFDHWGNLLHILNSDVSEIEKSIDEFRLRS